MARASRVGETTPRTMKASSAARVDPATPAMTRPSSTPTLEILFDKGYAGLTIDGVGPVLAGPPSTGGGRQNRRSSIAALTQSVGLSPTPDTGALRDDLLAFQRQQLKMMDRPE